MINVSTCVVAGRLKNYVSEWRKLTDDPQIIDIVENCHFDIKTEMLSELFHQNYQYKFNERQNLAVNNEINKLLHLGVLKKVEPENGQILSPIFLHPRKMNIE